jgi:hypothetical protein
MPRRKLLWAVLMLLIVAAGWWWLSSPAMIEYAVYTSPSGSYRVVVYRTPRRVAMPGQGSDAAGTVRLLDQSGKVLQETRFELLRELRPPEWEPGRVRIPLIAEWLLPEVREVSIESPRSPR